MQTREQLLEIAYGAVERNLGDVAGEDTSAEAMFSEAYTLGYEALAAAHVPHQQASELAQIVAQNIAQI